MNIKLQIGILIFVVISTLILVLWAIITEKRLKRFFLGRKAKDLEETIEHLSADIKRLSKEKEEMQREITTINTKMKKSIRGLETIRFNPFSDQGSNQSFAIGMLDEEGDGVVISSLYSRERMSIFAKPIKNKKSEYELSAEEKDVIEKAEVK